MCIIAIEPLTPFDRTLRIKLYKNNARSRLIFRIAKRSIRKIAIRGLYGNREIQSFQSGPLFNSLIEVCIQATVSFRDIILISIARMWHSRFQTCLVAAFSLFLGLSDE